jgi:uncharacterized membrane protein
MTRLRSMSGLTLLLGLSLAAPVSGDDLGTDGPKLDTLAWDCEGPRVVSKSESREVLWLFLPDRTLEMPLVPSASGAKYQKDGVLFWTKAGDQALLELHGQVHRCGVDRQASIWADAKLRGLDFRGVGNEPGWVLEIGPETIRFEYDYGTRQVELPRPSAETDEAARRTRFTAVVERLPFEILLEGVACNDVMSGEAFETRVELNWGDRHYVGCGRGLH